MAPEVTFTAVRVYNSKLAIISAVSDDLAEDNVDHSIVFTWSAGKWTKKPVPNAVVALCSVAQPAPQMFSICAAGQVLVASRTGFENEMVDESAEGPSPLVPLRTAQAIGAQIHVAGMARRVYRRSGLGTWEPIDNGVFVPRNERREGIGFLCIDGAGLSDITAAGYKGEIWYYNGRGWTKQESPTNLALNTLRYREDGLVYIAGMAGTIIRGAVNAWEGIPQQVTEDDFWGSAIFKGIPYFASGRAIYRLIGNNLEKVNLEALGPITTGHLDCDSEVLWSAGAKHLASTRDGSTWEAISGPA